MQDKKTKPIDISDLVFEDEIADTKPKGVDVSDLVFEDEPQTLWQKAKGAVSKMLGNDVVPTNKPMSEADYGELLKEDNDATVPSVALPNLEEDKTDPKWKVVQGEDGTFATLPTGAAVGEEIADGVHKSVAPERPEVDSETEWKRGLLAKTTDVKTNVANAKRVFEQGGYKLTGVVPNEEGSGLTQSNVYKLEKDGNEYIIDEDSFNSAIWDLRGDPASTVLTVATGGIGKAIGLGAVGNMVDQAISHLITGEELSTEQRALEVGKEAALFGGGETIVKAAPLVLKLGKGVVHDVPLWASKKIYNYIAGGNIDGAKSLAKDLFNVDDAHMDDALNQMMGWQKEVYDGTANIKDNVENLKHGANKIEAAKQIGNDLLSSAGNEKEQEKLLATVMAHPEGEKFIVPALDGNFDAATQVMRSVDNRRRQALDFMDAATGTEIKNSVKQYEKNVKDDYGKMRETFTDAFKESDYRFNLDDLKIEEKIKDMGSRIGDDYAQKQFEAMGNAIKSKIEGTRNGAGVTRNIDDLLDLWQRVNTFYGKYGKNLDKPDAQVFDSIKKGIGDEVDKALNEHTTPEIAKKLRSYFDDARDAYAKMYKVKGSKLYKSLMEEGKGSDDRVTALIKHAADDDGELHDLLSKLNVTDAGKAESAIVESVLRKHTIGERGKLQALDTAKALDELEKIKPFLKSDSVKEGIKLLEDMHQKFRHDFSLFKRASGVSVSTPSAGIATSAEGKLRAATASKIFTYVKSMIPFSRDAKALALQRHLGVALEKSRSPLEMAKKMAISDAVSLDDKRELKELIRIHNRAKSADNKAKVQKIKDELKAFDEKMEKKQIQEALEVKEFKKPELAELRAVEQLTGDDRFGSFAQTVRAIQDDKANEVQIKKYLEAKRAVADNLDDAVDAERVQLLPYKYAKVGDDEIATLKRVADEVGDADFDHRKVKRLLYDLEKKGVPRDLEYDRLYDDMMSYAKESDVPTPKQTASTEHVLEEPLDANGNAVFSTPSHLGVGAGTGTVNAFTNADANGDGEVTQDEFVQAFLVGLAGGAVGSKAIALGLKKVNPELYGQMSKAVDDGVDADGLVGMFAGKKGKTEYNPELLVQHNLTSSNVKHANSMGGLIVPSLAVVKKDKPLTGFGEITLIGDKGLIKPSRDTKVHGADVYSPRYPEVLYKTTSTDDQYITNELQPYAEKIGKDIGFTTYESIRNLVDEDAFLAKFLEDEGITYKIIKTKVDADKLRAAKKYYKAYMGKKLDAYDMKNDETFKSIVQKEIEDVHPDFFNSDKIDSQLKNMVNHRVGELNELNNKIKNKGKVDFYKTRREIRDKITKKNLWTKAEEAAKTFFNDHGAKEVIFEGRTVSGRLKYKEHTVANVVKKMKKDLIAGEAFNYGLGPVRAKYTRQFKNIQEIQKHKDKLVDKETFVKAKEELEDAFFEIQESLKPYYKYSSRHIDSNTLAGVFSDAANSSIGRELVEYGFNDVPEEIVAKMEILTKAMREMPTEYFESNILRAVDLGEFKLAVVPNGTPKDTIDILRKKGLKIKKYNPKEDSSRAKAIREYSEKNNVLFMHPLTLGIATAAATTTFNENNEGR